jgi:hypothetical protein
MQSRMFFWRCQSIRKASGLFCEGVEGFSGLRTLSRRERAGRVRRRYLCGLQILRQERDRASLSLWHGLSYTKFDYSDLKVAEPGIVGQAGRSEPAGPQQRIPLRCRGGGALRARRSPIQELKGFRRVDLAPGETRAVHFTLDRNAMAFYSTRGKTG